MVSGTSFRLAMTSELMVRVLTDIVLDADGYHAHTTERSDNTVASLQLFAFPSSSTPSSSSLINLYFSVITFI
jgi:hypothetical protein